MMIICHTMCVMKGNPRLLLPSGELSFEFHRDKLHRRGDFCSAKQLFDPSDFLHHQKFPLFLISQGS